MSFNGSGSFLINTAGQPVVSGTVISSTAFNALTADLATGLSTCITKDGQTTVTANIPMANYKFTGLGAGSAAGDSANLSQVQSTVVKLLASVSGTDTITAVGSPTVAAYAAGQMFYFVAAGDNTGAVTINIDSLGAKAVTRDGSVALAAGDIKSGEVVVIVYDGTRFQVVSQLNSSGDARFANVSIASSLYVGGVATIVGNAGFSANVSIASALSVGGVATVTGGATLNGGVVINEPGADVDFRVEGDTDANLIFADASADAVGVGTNAPNGKLHVVNSGSTFGVRIETADNPLIGARFAANADGAVAFLAKSRNATVGSHTIVQNGDQVGAIFGMGSNGTTFVPAGSIEFAIDGTPGSGSDMPGRIVFSTTADGAGSATERMRLDSSGRLGVGTTSPSSFVAAKGLALQGAYSTSNALAISCTGASATNQSRIGFYNGNSFGGDEQSAAIYAINPNAGTNNGGTLVFAVSSNGTATTPSERARITSGGEFCVGVTAANPIFNGVAGVSIAGSGLTVLNRTNGDALAVGRLSTDGDLVTFHQEGTQEGSISVSGATVSYNAFAGSHWSQLQDGSKPDILRGTVMESINELCEWPDEMNERLPKSKISDTAGSKKVYGVFMAWDNDWTATNDMYVTAVGAFICRVNGSVTVQEGDLLESNGDGTARVQADDIIRSSTIGKVTSTVKTHEYDDGSYCVPTVLYCG